MKTKLLGTLMIFFCVFLFVGVASASTADVLQPASDVVFNETLIVNATGIFDSVKIGKQGVGGVTFFNGSIVNETTDGVGNPVPVTFGDDVRIDGLLWRGAVSGPGDSMPIQLDDDVNVYGKLYVDKNITQNRTSYGAVKAMAVIDGSGSVNVERFKGEKSPSIVRSGLQGSYEIDFGFDISDRFISVVVDGTTFATADTFATYSFSNASDNNSIQVYTYDVSAGDLRDRDFTVVVY